MPLLRIIGDVHGQIEPDDVVARNARSYLEIIADAPYSIQIGDMGDGETYRQLIAQVDVTRHRFFPGNHDHFDQLPPHCLGDFGAIRWGGVELFFIRGAASGDRDKLVRLGRELGKTLWFEQEELTDDQMSAAEELFLRTRPAIVLTHDAPTEIACLAWRHACQRRVPNPEAFFSPSRTTAFHARLFDQHAPRVWLFGHHHHNWTCREGNTSFVCVGELAHVDIDEAGNRNVGQALA